MPNNKKKNKKTTNKGIIEQIAKIPRMDEIQVSIDESVMGGLVVGTAAAIGSLLMGPRGLLIGGVIGSAVQAARRWDTYRSVVEVLMELTPDKQEQLVRALQKAFHNISKQDLYKIVTQLVTGAGTDMARQIVMHTVESFFTN